MWDWLRSFEKSSRKWKKQKITRERGIFFWGTCVKLICFLFMTGIQRKQTYLLLTCCHFKRIASDKTSAELTSWHNVGATLGTDEAKIAGSIALESVCGLSHPADGWEWEITASLHGTSRSFTPPHIPKRRRAALWLTINSVILSHTLWSPLQQGFRSWQWCNTKSIASFGYF